MSKFKIEINSYLLVFIHSRIKLRKIILNIIESQKYFFTFQLFHHTNYYFIQT